MHLANKKHILTFPVRGGRLVNLVNFVQDEGEKKLAGRTGPFAEERPKEEMMQDAEGFSDECMALLEVRLFFIFSFLASFPSLFLLSPLFCTNPKLILPPFSGHREALRLGHLRPPSDPRHQRRPCPPHRRRRI